MLLVKIRSSLTFYLMCAKLSDNTDEHYTCTLGGEKKFVMGLGVRKDWSCK